MCSTCETNNGQYPSKDPDDVLDFSTDWAAPVGDRGPWLKDGDTIETSVWIVPDGIEKTDESNTDTVTVIWLKGGTPGVTYEVVNRITTVQGRTKDRSKYVYIEKP